MIRNRIFLPAALLITAACVCTGLIPGNLGGGADALPLTQTHRNEAGGYGFDLPEGWASQDLFSMTFAAETSAAIESDTIDGPIFLSVIGTAEEMAEGATTPEGMLDTSTAEEFTSEFSISEIKETTIGGEPGAYADLEGTDPDTGLELMGRIATVLSDTHAGFIIFAAPTEQWDDLLPTFEAMLDSFVFFEPDPEAGLGDFMPDTDDEVDEVDEPPPANEGGQFDSGNISAAGPIAIGDTKSAELEDGGIDDWTLNIPAGQAVTITVQPQDDDLDATLAIIGPDDAIIDEVDFGFSGGAETLSYQSADGGTYIVRVEPFGFGGGPYTITVVGSEGGGSSSGGGQASGGQTAIEFVNGSRVDMCRVYVTPSDAESWGYDHLDFADSPPGGSHVVSGIPAGMYDIKVEDCDFNVLAWNTEIDIPVSDGPIEAPVDDPAYTVTFNNDLDEPVCGVQLTRTEDLGAGWNRNLLGDDEPIEVGASRWFKAGQGEWGFRIETCGGFVIEVVGETISGKVTYSLSDF